MNQITPIPLARPPVLPQALEMHIGELARNGTRYPPDDPGDAGFFLAPPRPQYHPAAPAALVAFDRLCWPSNAATVATWLAKLSSGVSGAPSKDDMPIRIAGIRTACQHLPAGVWTDETLQQALQQFEWWPSAASIYGLLAPHAERLRSTREALRRIVAAARDQTAPPAEPKPEPTPAERQHVQALVEAFAAERSYNQPGYDAREGRRTRRAATDAELLMIYEEAAKQGQAGASTRVTMLRKKLAAVTGSPPDAAG